MEKEKEFGKYIRLNAYDYMRMVIEKNLTKLEFENWDFGICPTSDAISFDHKIYSIQIFATPYWEEEDGIPIEINTDYSDRGRNFHSFNITGNNDIDFEKYKEIIKDQTDLIDGMIKTILEKQNENY